MFSSIGADVDVVVARYQRLFIMPCGFVLTQVDSQRVTIHWFGEDIPVYDRVLKK
jgi:hypothetical protein